MIVMIVIKASNNYFGITYSNTELHLKRCKVSKLGNEDQRLRGPFHLLYQGNSVVAKVCQISRSTCWHVTHRLLGLFAARSSTGAMSRISRTSKMMFISVWNVQRFHSGGWRLNREKRVGFALMFRQSFRRGKSRRRGNEGERWRRWIGRCRCSSDHHSSRAETK